MTKNELDRFSDLLNTEFIMLSKPLIKLIGLQPAITFCELLSEYRYWKERNELTSDDYFYSTESNLTENTGLSASQLRNSFKVLKEKKFINIQRRGLPSVNHFKINPDILPLLEAEIKPADTKQPTPTKKSFGNFSF